MLWKRVLSTALGVGVTLPFAIAGDAILYPKPGVTWVQGYHHNVTWKLDVVLGNLGGTNDTMSAMSGNSTSAATSSTTGAMNSTIVTSTTTSAAPASTASSGNTTTPAAARM
ncbi:hypothetical protein GY45DRAFT_168556 [Cubamyces sp. BRFM 1775]|nr:hypothetical protein GY45DRAFT_168556 [Cubamyces sp. BRFM 1775]